MAIFKRFSRINTVLKPGHSPKVEPIWEEPGLIHLRGRQTSRIPGVFFERLRFKENSAKPVLSRSAEGEELETSTGQRKRLALFLSDSLDGHERTGEMSAGSDRSDA